MGCPIATRSPPILTARIHRLVVGQDRIIGKGASERTDGTDALRHNQRRSRLENIHSRFDPDLRESQSFVDRREIQCELYQGDAFSHNGISSDPVWPGERKRDITIDAAEQQIPVCQQTAWPQRAIRYRFTQRMENRSITNMTLSEAEMFLPKLYRAYDDYIMPTATDIPLTSKMPRGGAFAPA